MKTKTAIFLVLTGEAFVSALGLFRYGWNIEGLQAITRFSGRFSLLLFSFIFLLYPDNKIRLRKIMSENFFLSFALAHGIHLLELLSYVYLAGIALVPVRVAGGFLAYVLIFIMPWLQRINATGGISDHRFKMLGMVYLFYAWFVFFMTYVARLNGSFHNAGGSYTEHAVLMTWVCIMLGFKLATLLARKHEAIQ